MKRTISIILMALLLCTAGCAEMTATANVTARETDAAVVEVTIPPDGIPTQTLNAEGDTQQTSAVLLGTEGLDVSTGPSTTTPSPAASPAFTPSPTPDPTPKYTVDPIDDKKAYLNAGTANLREGPSTEYAILEELFAYETLTVTGSCAEWYRVKAGNETGFVLAEFVEYGTAPTPTPSFSVKSMDDKDAYVNAGSANLREGPSTEFEIIVELGRNEEITVTGTSGDWYRVEYGKKKGFMLSEFVEFGAPPTPTPKVTPTPDVPQEEEPSEDDNGSSGNASGVDSNDYFSGTSEFTAAELLLIAQVVQEEAKGSSVEARAAVANTIYNRYLSSKYPDTIEGIIFQENQYTVADDEDELRSVKPIDKTIEAVTQIFIHGDTFLPEDVVFFRAASRGTSWGDKREYYATYGNNAFFRSFY